MTGRSVDRDAREAAARGDFDGLAERLMEALRSALSELSATERAVFLLRRGLGLDDAATAAVVGASPRDCRAAERDAQRRLRRRGRAAPTTPPWRGDGSPGGARAPGR